MAKKLKLEKSNKKEKWRLFSGEEGPFDTERLRGAHIQLFSNTRLIIEGCLGVYEYNENYLKLKLLKGALVVCGNGFDISSFENTTIIVNGKIGTLEFCD